MSPGASGPGPPKKSPKSPGTVKKHSPETFRRLSVDFPDLSPRLSVGVSETGSAKTGSAIDVRIDDAGSILKFRIGFSLWFFAVASQLRPSLVVVLEASRQSILKFRIGFLSLIGGRLPYPCLPTPFPILRFWRLSGILWPEAPADIFETCSAFPAQRARETPVRGGLVPNTKLTFLTLFKPPWPSNPCFFFSKKKAREPPKKGRVFLFTEPLKSLEKKGKTPPKARINRKTKKQGNWKKQGLEGQAYKVIFLPFT